MLTPSQSDIDRAKGAAKAIEQYGERGIPLYGPQLDAYMSEADILLFGGAAGGSKSYLGCLLSTNEHCRTLYVRDEAKQLGPVVDEIANILGTRDGYNSQSGVWRVPNSNRVVQFAGIPNVGDEQRFQGNARDLLFGDEVANIRESQIRFLMGWVRPGPGVPRGQRCRVVFGSNPPTSSEGEWIIRMFAPWLDPEYPNKAKPGELRWAIVVDGTERWVDGPARYRIAGDEEVYTAQSYTFVPSKVSDNPYLMGTKYLSRLQAMPEPLRSQMLHGDFMAGREDSDYQVIPSAWVRAAQSRWEPRDVKGTMLAMGVDVARGGQDKTVIARRHGWWFDEMIVRDGADTPDGNIGAALALQHQRNGACISVDVIGVGSSVYDALMDMGVTCKPINSSNASDATDKSGQLTFGNLRAEMWWKMRDLLDPSADTGIAIPPGETVRSDLCAPRYKTKGRSIMIEAKDEIKKRIGRSPDIGDALVYCATTPARPKRKAQPYQAMAGAAF